MTDVVDAAKALRNRRQKLVTAENKASKKGPKKRAKPAKRSAKVSAADAKKSERLVKGVKTFGPPMQGNAFDRQSTDSSQ